MGQRLVDLGRRPESTTGIRGLGGGPADDAASVVAAHKSGAGRQDTRGELKPQALQEDKDYTSKADLDLVDASATRQLVRPNHCIHVGPVGTD